MRLAALLFAVVTALASGSTTAERLTLIDDTGREVTLDAPAERIVSLAPNITEILFAAGAGHRIVATVNFSDHPTAAREIPRIGDSDRLDLESILSHEPDLVVGWESGNPRRQVERLRELGVPVYMSEARQPIDIGRTLLDLGWLADTRAEAEAAARDFLGRFETLRAIHGEREPVRVFYQIWHDPLMTVNGQHMISTLIDGCGGENVFADLPALAPRIGAEAVLERDPEVIVASGSSEDWPDWLDDWRAWSELAAVQRDNLYFIPPDIIQRQSVRILDGMERLCAQIDEAREKRADG